MSKISEIIQKLEEWAPPSYQESYDNAGLLTGDTNDEVKGMLISLDCTEEIVDEAIAKGANLIIAHHPIIFGGLKRLTGRNYVERTIIKAIRSHIAIYAIHTNLDNVRTGVNAMIAQKIGLRNTRVLAPKSTTLSKLEFYVPQEATGKVLGAIHAAGAGQIGNYEKCSFKVNGVGAFEANQDANPTVGQRGKQEFIAEDRVEVILPTHRKGQIISAMKQAHPYEEVAHFVYPVANKNQDIGSGMIGELESSLTQEEFLSLLKHSMKLSSIKYTALKQDKVKKVAVCGGAGSFLLGMAKSQDADAFVSSDFKYHEFFDGEGKTMIADIGHYESEVYTKDLIDTFLREKFTNIATYLSEVNTNPVKYF
jgi:dinuclear metal center YbgI/SA1388 family protein